MNVDTLVLFDFKRSKKLLFFYLSMICVLPTNVKMGRLRIGMAVNCNRIKQLHGRRFSLPE